MIPQSNLAAWLRLTEPINKNIKFLKQHFSRCVKKVESRENGKKSQILVVVAELQKFLRTLLNQMGNIMNYAINKD